MKFIHLTDTHVIGGGRRLYGADPARRLRLAVDSINADHGDAQFTIVTGDLTHWGDPEAYAAFAAQIGRLTMPVHLMVGNHDKTPDFASRFPMVPRDASGFVQFAFDLPHTAAQPTGGSAGGDTGGDTGPDSARETPSQTATPQPPTRAICLDTTRAGSHAGAMCPARLSWLDARLAETDGPVLLFMHHPPFATGIASMDAISMQDADALYQVLAPHVPRIRHLFFGHVHRAIFGNWRGISFSCMRGLNHQVALDLTGDAAAIHGDLHSPAYGVVLMGAETVVVHLNEFACTAPRFTLQAPAGQDGTDWALSMRHPGFADL